MRVRARVLVMSIACLALAGCGSRDETTVPKSQSTMRVAVPAGAASASLVTGAETLGNPTDLRVIALGRTRSPPSRQTRRPELDDEEHCPARLIHRGAAASDPAGVRC